jgi:hypothetical protein
LDDVNWVATPKAQHSWNFKILHNIHYAKLQKARRRQWYISPEGFRELRHTCLLNRKSCAAYLGVV